MNQFYTCYPNGKFKALTLSYDDGQLFDKRLVDILNKNGLKGTFHLNGGLFGGNRITHEEIAEVYQGHEVAAHTYTHPTIARCPIDKVAQEVLTDRQALEKLVSYPVRGFSYPNGSFNQDIKELLPFLGIEYGRIVGNSDNFNLPTDWYEWQATCHHNHRLLELSDEFISLDKSQYLYLMYVWGHSFEFDGQDNWDLIEEFAEKMGKEENIWFTTNIEFKDYMEAAKRLQFSVAGDFVYNPSACSVWIRKDAQVLEIPGGTQVDLK